MEIKFTAIMSGGAMGVIASGGGGVHVCGARVAIGWVDTVPNVLYRQLSW